MNKIATLTATQTMSDINDISSYDYFLPSELIAKEPVLPKEEARLLILKKQKR